MQKNVMVYGSSVSRDAFQEVGAGYHLVSSVTNQSMISALSQPAKLLQGELLAPGFQSRSLKGDVSSTLMQHVRRHAAGIDVLVMDLNDERLGVVALPDGSYVTRSPDLVDSGLLETVHGRTKTIYAATERHWTLWESSANRFFKAINALGLKQKTIILNTPWADSAEDLRPNDEFGVPSASELISYLGECCAHIRSLGFTVQTLPEELRYSVSGTVGRSTRSRFGHEATAWMAARIRSAATAASELPHSAQSLPSSVSA